MEAAELLGVGKRTFRHWCQPYEEDGEAGLWTGGWAMLPGGGFRLTVRRGRSALPHAPRGLHGEAFHQPGEG